VSPILGSISEVLDSIHELRSPNGLVASLLAQVFIVLYEMLIKVPLKSHVPNESLPANAALKLDALINFRNRKDIEPIERGQKSWVLTL
jgi:hypothetical protein